MRHTGNQDTRYEVEPAQNPDRAHPDQIHQTRLEVDVEADLGR